MRAYPAKAKKSSAAPCRTPYGVVGFRMLVTGIEVGRRSPAQRRRDEGDEADEDDAHDRDRDTRAVVRTPDILRAANRTMSPTATGVGAAGHR